MRNAKFQFIIIIIIIINPILPVARSIDPQIRSRHLTGGRKNRIRCAANLRVAFENEDRHGGRRIETWKNRQQRRVLRRPGITLLQKGLQSSRARGGPRCRWAFRRSRRGVTAAASWVGVVVTVVVVEQAPQKVERERVRVVTEMSAANSKGAGQQLDVRNAHAALHTRARLNRN